MVLSLTQPSLLGMLLLLLVSNVLQWENVSSAPIQDNEVENGAVSLKDLFNHAITLSRTTNNITMEMRKLFVLGFLKDKKHMIKTLNSCHTFSLHTPETVEEAGEMSLEEFLKIILSIVYAWDNPLHHLVTELRGMKGAPDEILLKAQGIETLNKELLKSIMTILRKVHPGIEGNKDYPVWNDLESLQADDEELHFFALYKLFYCLRVDAYTVDLYLKYLMCVLVGGDICSSVKF
ncbi:prolactin-7C1-like isoform X2 [Acomys russatus]|uniref:prolactin-7C1-like isoform X2 n=1 Tax=Acomys russatus TaxID=60746 RepID=UPI0021E1BF39|nr:prolactin-7C1-like isoform X2 [Acomys russatus]